MKPKGGKRPGAGRKKGTPNRLNRVIKQKLVESGDILPLQFLLQIMRAPEPKPKKDEDAASFGGRWRRWADDRIDAAKAATPYIHPRLESIEHKGDPNNPIETRTSLLVEFVEPA